MMITVCFIACNTAVVSPSPTKELHIALKFPGLDKTASNRLENQMLRPELLSAAPPVAIGTFQETDGHIFKEELVEMI